MPAGTYSETEMNRLQGKQEFTVAGYNPDGSAYYKPVPAGYTVDTTTGAVVKIPSGYRWENSTRTGSTLRSANGGYYFINNGQLEQYQPESMTDGSGGAGGTGGYNSQQ